MRYTRIPFTICIFFCFLSFLTQAQHKYPQDYFRSPLNIPLYSSGTFGELRSNHFHSGLDIKTQGKIGQPVLAAAEGTIVRIKVSPYGFGKALYLKHPDGYTTVYAHLHEFDAQLEAYVVEQMRKKEQNEVNLFPPAGRFNYQQGDQIALSGNSGGSGGPHLHFEVRDTRTEKIINPLLFGFKVADNLPPELGALQVYFHQNGQFLKREEYKVKNTAKGKYVLETGDKVMGSAEISFGLYAIDKQDKTRNRNGVYELKLFVADELQHVFRMETFAFAETRYINSHIDYELKACCRRSSHRLFQEPGNRLSTYPVKAKAGHLKFNRDTVLPVRIEARDAAGNLSTLDFDLVYKANADLEIEPLEASDYLVKSVPIQRSNPEVISDADYELGFKEGSFYRDFQLEVKQSPFSSAYSDLITINSRKVPVHRYYDLKLRLSKKPKGLDPSKLFIASYRNGKYDDYEGGYYKNGWVISRTRQLGEFAIAIDTTAPEINAHNFRDKEKPKVSTIIIKVKDDISGIEKYELRVDGVWVPVYYDAKKNRLLSKMKYWPKAQGSKQVLKLRVEDDRKNQSEKIWELFVS